MITNEAILITIATAEVIPAVMHSLLFVNKKLSPLMITDDIKPTIM